MPPGLLRRGSTQAAIDVTANGDNILIAAVAGRTIRVIQMFFTVSAATALTFKDGTGTSLTGAMSFGANGGMVLEHNPSGDPWFITSAGNAFIVNQSGTAQISGRIYYEQTLPI